MRAHARQRRRETPRLLADDVGIDQEERLVVAVLYCRPDFLEVQARLGVRVEEVGLFKYLLSDRLDGLSCYACAHLHLTGLQGEPRLREYRERKNPASRSTLLVLVMMTSFCPGSRFKIRSKKASGPGLTVRIADNRTGARLQESIGTAPAKSSDFSLFPLTSRTRRSGSRSRCPTQYATYGREGLLETQGKVWR